MKRIFFLALLVLSIFWTQGAFANSAPNNYPKCYQGYGSSSPNYNGTNGDKFNTDGWCIDGFGVLTPRTGMTITSTQPNSYGGYAVPTTTYNVGTSANPPVPASTYDALIQQQTGSHIIDYGGFSPLATIDSLSGIGGHYVLPPAYPGEIFTISSASKSVITVDTLNPTFATLEGLIYTTADTIEWSPANTAVTAGQNIKSPGYAGDSVTLYCAVQGQWSISAMQGAVGSNATSDALWTVISTG